MRASDCEPVLLLADRFKLALHRETKEMPVYALVVAKSGPKLNPWKEADGPGPQFRGQPGVLTCTKAPLKMFAEAIPAQRVGRSVSKLESERAPVDVLVIDHVEKASAN